MQAQRPRGLRRAAPGSLPVWYCWRGSGRCQGPTEGGAPLAEWAEGDLAIGGIAIHYYRMRRAGEPPVVLLHGFSDGGLA